MSEFNKNAVGELVGRIGCSATIVALVLLLLKWIVS